MHKVNANGKQNRGFLNNRGTTMLETLIAFVVLMVILGVLYNIIAFCSELKMSATDMNTYMQDFSVEIYNKNTTKIFKVEKETKVDAGVKKPLFYLELSDETQKDLNGCNSVAEENKRISLYNLNAVTYVYDAEGDTRNIIPKATRFVHKHDWNNR
jgi:hypothetical protein